MPPLNWMSRLVTKVSFGNVIIIETAYYINFTTLQHP